jgi:hypothetical protein
VRYLILLSGLAFAACSGAPSHELAQTSDKDPTWQLNPDKWAYQENALITPPPGKIEPAPAAAMRVPPP